MEMILRGSYRAQNLIKKNAWLLPVVGCAHCRNASIAMDGPKSVRHDLRMASEDAASLASCSTHPCPVPSPPPVLLFFALSCAHHSNCLMLVQNEVDRLPRCSSCPTVSSRERPTFHSSSQPSPKPMIRRRTIV